MDLIKLFSWIIMMLFCKGVIILKRASLPALAVLVLLKCLVKAFPMTWTAVFIIPLSVWVLSTAFCLLVYEFEFARKYGD